jgi:hypothetical protein
MSKIQKVVIANNTNDGVSYINLVNSIANIHEYKEVYLCLDKFQCEVKTHNNIVIRLDEILSSYENQGKEIKNSRIIDTSFYTSRYEVAADQFYLHNVNNPTENWIKINSLENLNNLRFSFSTINFGNMLSTNINALQFILHLRIKLV